MTDFKTGKQFQSRPETTGFKKDFYAVDVEKVAPDYFETEILSDIESRVAPIIKDVVASRQMPHGEAFTDLMHFLCLMLVKTPKARRVAEHGVDWLNKLIVRIALRTPEQWTDLQSQMRDAGMEPDGSVTYEQMKEFVESDRFTVKADQNWLLYATLRGAEELMPTMIGRSWSILHSAKAGFICSDHPVAVSFTRRVPAMWSPAPGLPYTEVQCPLSQHVMIVGSFDGPSVQIGLNRKDVARYNARALRQADRFVYSAEKEFLWFGGHEIKSGPEEIVAARLKRNASASRGC